MAAAPENQLENAVASATGTRAVETPRRNGALDVSQETEIHSLASQYESRQRKETSPVDLVPKEKFKRLAVNLTPLPENAAREQEEFELDAKTDLELYRRLAEAQRVISSIKGEASLTGLGKMLEYTFPALQAREAAIKKLSSQGAERIFHSNEELILALGVLEQHERLAAAALAKEITNNGERQFEATLPPSTDLEIVLRERCPVLPERARNAIVNAIDRHDGVALRTILGGLEGIATGALFRVLLAPRLGLIPEPVYSPGVTAASLGGAALVGAIGGFFTTELFQGREGEAYRFRLGFPPSESRLVTAYADHLGTLALNEQTAGDYFTSLEKLRHNILRRSGFDFEQLTDRSMVDLGMDALNPDSSFVSRGASLYRFANEREIALRKLLGNRNFADLTPEQQLQYTLEASDAAGAALCKHVALEVADEITGAGKGTRTEEVDALDGIAADFINGKRRVVAVNEAAVTVSRTVAEQQEAQLAEARRIKAELDSVTQRLDPLETGEQGVAVKQATRDRRQARYAAPLVAGGNSEIQQLNDDIQTITDQIEGVAGGGPGLLARIATAEGNVQTHTDTEETERLTIATLEREKARTDKNAPDPANPDNTIHERLDRDIAAAEGRRNTARRSRETAEREAASLNRLLTERQGERTRLRTNLDNINARLETAEEELATANARVASLRHERDDHWRRLTDLITPPVVPVGGGAAVPQPLIPLTDLDTRITELERTATAARAAFTQLNNQFTAYHESRGEPTTEDRQIATACARVAELSRDQDRTVGGQARRGKFNRIMSDVVFGVEATTNKRKIDLLADPDHGYQEWQRLFFGPNALVPEEARVNQRLLRRDDMVMAAVDVWHLTDDYFGRNEAGQLRMAVVRDRMRQIAELEERIANRPGASPRLSATLERMRRENNTDINILYGQTCHLFGVNEVKTRDYTQELIDRMRRKALRGQPFGSSYEVAHGQRLAAEIGETAQTPDGSIAIEPPHVVDGVERDHGSIRFTTPEGHRITGGRQVPVTIETVFVRPEVAGGAVQPPDSLRLRVTLRATREMYEAIPAPRPVPPTRWPDSLLNAVDQAGNPIFYETAVGLVKRPFEEVNGQVVNQEVNVPDTAAALALIGRWNNLGNLAQEYPRAMGRALIEASSDQRIDRFNRFPRAAAPLVMPVAGANYNVYYNNIDRRIMVQPAGGAAANLEAFVNSAVFAAWPPAARNDFLQAIGTEALRALQRF